MKIRLSKKGILKEGYLKQKYGKSSQIRFIDGFAISPIGYIQKRNPMYKKKIINKYTPEGREAIHKELGMSLEIIQRLMERKVKTDSIEFTDNRISLYAAQNGKCAVTGEVLTIDEIHCHHIQPKKLGGKDDYKNLVIIHKFVHILIHSINPETTNKYLNLILPDEKMLKKINRYRQAAGNTAV